MLTFGNFAVFFAVVILFLTSPIETPLTGTKTKTSKLSSFPFAVVTLMVQAPPSTATSFPSAATLATLEFEILENVKAEETA